MHTDSNPHIAIDAKTGPRIRSGLRRRRVRGIEATANIFHVMSRFVKEVPFMDDVEREGLRKLIWKMSAFMGLEVLTYCVMGNHFHALVEVPDRAAWLQRFEGAEGEEKLLRHLATFYSRDFMAELRAEIASLRARGDERRITTKLEEFRRRFCDLSIWTKEVKGRFAKWINKRRGRRGALWMDRFKSLLVQGGNAALVVAAYIDLNPVRAKMVDDPKDYRWCGYAEALAGDERAQRGLCRLLHLKHWVSADPTRFPSARPSYRRVLYGQGRERRDVAGTISRAGFSAARSHRVFNDEGGELSIRELVLQQALHISKGFALGTAEWIAGLKDSKRQ